MDFVHDVDAALDLGGRIDRLVAQGADAVHAVVGRGVELHHVEKAAAFDAEAARAAVAGVAVHGAFAVDRLGENFGAGGLARAARAGEEIGVREPPLSDLTLQRRGDMLLPHHVRKRLGPPLAVKRLIHLLRLPFRIKKLLRIQPRNRHPHGT